MRLTDPERSAPGSGGALRCERTEPHNAELAAPPPPRAGRIDVLVLDNPPAGGEADWTLRLEVLIRFYGPIPPADVGPTRSRQDDSLHLCN